MLTAIDLFVGTTSATGGLRQASFPMLAAGETDANAVSTFTASCSVVLVQPEKDVAREPALEPFRSSDGNMSGVIFRLLNQSSKGGPAMPEQRPSPSSSAP